MKTPSRKQVAVGGAALLAATALAVGAKMLLAKRRKSKAAGAKPVAKPRAAVKVAAKPRKTSRKKATSKA